MTRVRPIQMAVVGLGHFAQNFVLPAMRHQPDVEIAGLVSGSEEKLRRVGDKYGVNARAYYADLERLLDSELIEAVYIAVPNDMHAEMAVRAARRGVHVLCEKPMAPTEAECEAMITACRRAGVKLMIGYRLHFDPANLRAIQAVRDGDIGEARIFSSTFTMQVRAKNTRVQARAGAGPLYDIGIYCINAARYIFRAEPYEVVALPLPHRQDPRFGAADEAVAAILRFPGDRVAQFVASYGATDTARYDVIGTDGTISLDHAYDLVEPMHLEVVNGSHRERTYKKHDQVAAEVAYFAQCIREDVDPEPSGEEGLADVRAIRAIERAGRTGRAVGIERVENVRRPVPEQAIEVRMHKQPSLVGVQPPTR
jgi:predicted dehydrogenase